MKALRKDQVLSLAIVTVVVMTFGLVFYLPQRSTIAQLSQEREATSSAVSRDKQKATELVLLSGEVKRMGEQLKMFNRRLPDQQELGTFLKDICNAARASGLESPVIEPQKVMQGELYMQAPFAMQFRGGFDALARFLVASKSMPRLTHVSAVNVRNDKDVSGKCTIDLVMTIYYTRG